MKKDNYLQLLIGKILCSSVKNLFDTQPDIFEFTFQTVETEWNLAHHLAIEIQKYIFWLNCDIELIKSNLENKRPDIVFHKRGINSLNFLIVELKHRGANNIDDINKIKNYWLTARLNYRLGASIKINNEDNYCVTIITKYTEKIYKCNAGYIKIPRISRKKQTQIIKIVDKILSLTQSEDYLQNPEKQEKVKEYERKIDQLVYELYGLTPKEIAIVEEKQ
jgi:hypothetical protein